VGKKNSRRKFFEKKKEWTKIFEKISKTNNSKKKIV